MRTIVVTGSASGIGQATAARLAAGGDRVIGVDIRDADVVADLTDPADRAAMVERVRELAGGRIDGVIANAGLSAPIPATIAVNYFGAVATLEGLLPLLAGAPEPRAAATASMASLMPTDDALVAACLAGDEAAALARCAELVEAGPAEANKIYSSSKNALVRWLRTAAPSPAWAGASVPLNAIGPGVVQTPMTTDLRSSDEAVEQLKALVPMPLNGFIDAEDCADLLEWLISPANGHLCGQIIFIDGGFDASVRGAAAW